MDKYEGKHHVRVFFSASTLIRKYMFHMLSSIKHPIQEVGKSQMEQMNEGTDIAGQETQ